MIQTVVKVRGSINGIRNTYNINSFYYSNVLEEVYVITIIRYYVLCNTPTNIP